MNSPIGPHEANAILGMVRQWSSAHESTNEQLARWLIIQATKVPMGSKADDLYEAAAERLFPGIVDKLAEEEKANP
jgi:hypothetical protein